MKSPSTDREASEIPTLTGAGVRTGSAAYPLDAAVHHGTKNLFSDRETTKLLGCSKSTVWRWAAEGILPKPLRIGGISRWKRADIDAVIAEAQLELVAA